MFVFHNDKYINLLINVEDGLKSQVINYLETAGFIEDKRRRVWSFKDDIVAYILWSWTHENWYISIYLNEHIKKI